MSVFIHLRTHSDYSMGDGAAKVKDLVAHCRSEKMPALCLSDTNNMFAAMEFALECTKAGIQPIMGSVLTVNISSFGEESFGDILLIAKDKAGYLNLLKLISNAYTKRKDFTYIEYEELKEHATGLIALIGENKSHIAQLFNKGKYDQATNLAQEFHSLFEDRLYLELIRYSDGRHQALESFLLDIAANQEIAIVATNKVCFITPDMHEAHDALLCITRGTYLLEDNREKSDPEHYFKSAKEMCELFSDLPEAIENTVNIAKRCSIMAESSAPLLPSFAGTQEDEVLKEQSISGLESKITHITDKEERQKYFDRLELELSIINKMKFSGYFLIVSDFIKWSKKEGIPVGPGRGSGAGSMVAWALEITDLDPLRFGLLFERFLNPERVSMPDFDIDFCQDRRDEVISYVRNRYGEDKVSHIVTFGKLQARAVLRDVGRVLQMPYPVIDRICKMVPHNPANPITLKQAIDLDKDLQKSRASDPDIDKLLTISLKLEGMNRHVSTHAAGIVIADRPIVEVAPLYQDSESDIPAVQYSMKYAEIAGLVKFDFLGLKTLTMISWACNLINKEQQKIDISNIPLADEKTYKMLSDGKTIGVFQFEGAGMREAMKSLKPDKLDDLIALVSLYRPGPMANIPSYINRKQGLEEPDYIHPKLKKTLEETYGIIIYQEQVMEIAQVLAGYSLGQADLLRRAMGKKIKSEMQAQREIFVKGAIANGIDKKQAEEIFDLLDKFASYGFNKSHAAAYALISYQTAYLKANYTVEFLTSAMNLDIDYPDKINVFCVEAKHFEIEVLPPDVNKSSTYFIIEGSGIRYGLAALKNVGNKIASQIAEERETNGAFKDIYDFFERVPGANRKTIESLIKSGAFDSLYGERNQLLQSLEVLMSHGQWHNQSSKQVSLFGENDSTMKPELKQSEPVDHKVLMHWEFEALGFYLMNHPLNAYEKRLKKAQVMASILVEEVASDKAGTKVHLAGVVTSKKIKSSPRGKYAIIQVSDQHGIIEVSIFDEPLLYQNSEILEVGNALYFIANAIKDANGLRVIAQDIKTIEKGLANYPSRYCIRILNSSLISQIKSLVNDTASCYVRIEAQLEDGSIIKFASKNALRMEEDDIKVLQGKTGVMVIEE